MCVELQRVNFDPKNQSWSFWSHNHETSMKMWKRALIFGRELALLNRSTSSYVHSLLSITYCTVVHSVRTLDVYNIMYTCSHGDFSDNCPGPPVSWSSFNVSGVKRERKMS